MFPLVCAPFATDDSPFGVALAESTAMLGTTRGGERVADALAVPRAPGGTYAPGLLTTAPYLMDAKFVV